MFDALLKNIKNNGRTAKLVTVKIRGSNLHLLIIKLLKAGKAMLEKD